MLVSRRAILFSFVGIKEGDAVLGMLETHEECSTIPSALALLAEACER
ncbi:MAG: hypothetical protein GWP14_03240 [Actinobacteria bacterium]|nr:hypothetical protein [Actinomycetota bacterium]